jgi:hypothetical protein
VAWVRTVRTASGATAVQIAESVDGRRRIVRHVGSARDEAELGLLLAQARDLLADDLQGVLDLGMHVPQRVRPMAPAPAPPALFGMGAAPVPIATSRARVLRTSNRTLFDAMATVFDQLGFDVVGDGCFRDLVVARVVEPTSLLDADRVLADLARSKQASPPSAIVTARSSSTFAGRWEANGRHHGANAACNAPSRPEARTVQVSSTPPA